MKKTLALAFAFVAAFGVVSGGAAEARDRHDDRRDQRHEERYDNWQDSRWNNGRIGGSWSRTCSDSYVRRGVLYAECRTRSGKWRQTALRIDNCRSAENSNGRLICTQRR